MLIHRLATASILSSLFLLAFFNLSDIYWGAFILVFVMIAATEWAAIMRYTTRQRIYFMGIILLVAALILCFPNFIQQSIHLVCYVIAMIFWMIVLCFWLRKSWHLRHPVGTMLIGWVLLLPVWMAMVELHQFFPEVLLAVMCAVWIADSAAYLTGKRYGKTKLAPKISPGKTWQGVYGALCAVTVYAIVLLYSTGLSWTYLALALTTVGLSILGDLFESLIKRQAGAKDSGTILPGHGGMLDRIDGLIPVLPFTVIYIYYGHLLF